MHLFWTCYNVNVLIIPYYYRRILIESSEKYFIALTIFERRYLLSITFMKLLLVKP